MKTKLALLTVGATVLLTLGLSVGASIGDDGTNSVTDRLAGEFGKPAVQRVSSPSARAVTGGKKSKPKVLHGSGAVVDLAPGAESLIALKCPKKFPVPISAGLETSMPGIFPGVIARSPNVARAMVVGAVNTTEATDGQWSPTIACMKGVKEA